MIPFTELGLNIKNMYIVSDIEMLALFAAGAGTFFVLYTLIEKLSRVKESRAKYIDSLEPKQAKKYCQMLEKK